jgi:hypothetical protein
VVDRRATRGRLRVTRRGVACPISLTGVSSRPSKTPSKEIMAIFVHGAINRSGGQLWLWLGTLGT